MPALIGHLSARIVSKINVLLGSFCCWIEMNAAVITSRTMKNTPFESIFWVTVISIRTARDLGSVSAPSQ